MLEQPRELTERSEYHPIHPSFPRNDRGIGLVWGTISPKLLKSLEIENDLRTRCLPDARKEEIIRLHDQLRGPKPSTRHHTAPNRFDMWYLPSIESIVDDAEVTTVAAVSARFEGLRTQYESEVQQHTQLVIRQLAKTIMDRTSFGAATYDRIDKDIQANLLPQASKAAYELNLVSSACAVFTCAEPDCHKKLTYPSMFHHGHIRRVRWNIDLVLVSTLDYSLCSRMVRDLGLPLTEAGTDDWLRCRRCVEKAVGGRAVCACCPESPMTWSELVSV